MEPVKLKALMTVIILIAGSALVLVIGTGSSVTAFQATGVAIDFGQRDVSWEEVDLHANGDPISALEVACTELSFTVIIKDNVVKEIDGIVNDNQRSWGFWVVKTGELNWTKINDTNGINLLNYPANVWAFCADDEVPTVGVDQRGRSIFGYPQPLRVATLSPSITEIIGSLNAVSTLVATDKYSNYPEKVVAGQNAGSIAVIGDFVSPSYELIMKSDPDIVYCDGSQYTHWQMAERLEKSNVNAIVMYSGESIGTILDNIYIMGVSMRYDMRALIVIDLLEDAVKQITDLLLKKSTEYIDTMFSLSSDKSPWVSGKYTFIDDIATRVFSENVIAAYFNGWVHITPSLIADTNPSVIIILSSEYSATAEDYKIMMENLPAEWQSTKAYQTGQIYILCDELAEMSGRAGPRFAQLMELTARILHGDAFGEKMPKFIGNDYEKYLTITKDLGFNQ